MGLLLSALAHMFPAYALTSNPEYDLKAAFIARFVDFIEWPSVPPELPAGAPFQLCIRGKNPFGSALDKLADLTQPKGRPLKIVQPGTLGALKHCDVLFIATSEAGDLARIMAATKTAPVLTIGDTAGFSEQGVMINFYPHADTYRFEVNLTAAESAGFRLSARLLKLARIVGPVP